MMKKPGFTLIELLVVIAVIALLIAILVPALGRARDQARPLACRSNLKQYGVALRMYLDDNNSKFPNAQTWLKSGSNTYVRKRETPDGRQTPSLRDSISHHLTPFGAAETIRAQRTDGGVGDTRRRQVIEDAKERECRVQRFKSGSHEPARWTKIRTHHARLALGRLHGSLVHSH